MTTLSARWRGLNFEALTADEKKLVFSYKFVVRVLPPLLHLKDGAETLEAKSFAELRARLRDKYPDDAFERTLHYMRDREAEERRERALNGFAELLAKAAVDEMIEEETRGPLHP